MIETKVKYYLFLQELSFIRPLCMLSHVVFAGNKDPYNSNSFHVGWRVIDGVYGGKKVNCTGITDISGTGPFKFVSRKLVELDDETTVDEEVIFSGRSDYWDGTSSIETLIVKHYKDSIEVKNALLDGSLDLVWDSGVFTAQDLVDLDEDETNDISVFHSDDIQNMILLLNSDKAPLDNTNLCKTIIHAIDRKPSLMMSLVEFMRQLTMFSQLMLHTVT